MIKVNTRNGATLQFDLSNPVEFEAWSIFQADPASQRSITGMAVLANRSLYTLPIPVGFSAKAYMAELVWDRDNMPAAVGERISVQADDVLLVLTVYYKGVARADLRKIGKPRFLSPGRPWPQQDPSTG